MSDILAESPQVERTLLALTLKKGNEARSAASGIKPVYFGDLRHATVWSAIQSVDVCSPVIVLEKLRDSNKLEAAGSSTYFEELCKIVPAQSESVPVLAEKLVNLAKKRALGRVALEFMNLSKRSDIKDSDLNAIAMGILRNTMPAERGRAIRSFGEGLEEFADELYGFGNDSMGQPLPIMWSNLRSLKGYAKAVMPRKVWLIGADSGVGKTSLVETQVDYWRQRGFNGFYWGSEWSYKEYVYRAVQRWGGSSMEDVIEHKVWHNQKQQGIPEQQRTGTPLTAEAIARSTEVYNTLKKWRGDLKFLDQSANVEVICDQIAEQAALAREHKRPLSFAVLDYAQLAGSAGDRPNERMSVVMSRFKQVCIDENLVGVITSQLTKDAGRAAAAGEMLGQDVFQNLRSDESNLALAIVRELLPDGSRKMEADVYVVKNSEGETGKRNLILDGNRMRWQDARVEHIKLNEV